MIFSSFYPIVDNIDSLQARINAGFDLIQLRVKEKNEELIASAINLTKGIKHKKITLIVNDYPELVKKYDGDGVHLGKSDIPLAEARELLGARKIIGATTNSFDDILNVANIVDYVGLGTYKPTKTKENITTILGDKIIDIKHKCDKAHIKIPIYIIGGIEEADINAIINLGYKVAGKTLFENLEK